jgi:hypothetical protein
VARNWIAGATSNAHGQFRRKAQAAGMSTRAYAAKEAGAPGKTGKQARLAKTLMKMADGGKVRSDEYGSIEQVNRLNELDDEDDD